LNIRTANVEEDHPKWDENSKEALRDFPFVFEDLWKLFYFKVKTIISQEKEKQKALKWGHLFFSFLINKLYKSTEHKMWKMNVVEGMLIGTDYQETHWLEIRQRGSKQLGSNGC